MSSYCVFNVGERRVGIALDHVREIIEPRLVVPTPIPLTPSFVHGLFNLRGQVLPYLDLSPFVGAKETAPAPGPDERAVIVERGQLRFATTGRRIDTVEADPNTFAPLENAALLPALDAEASTDYGRFHVIHLDRLEACLTQSLKLAEPPVAPAQPPPTEVPATTATAATPSANALPVPSSEFQVSTAALPAPSAETTNLEPGTPNLESAPVPAATISPAQPPEAGSPKSDLSPPTSDLSPAPSQPETGDPRSEVRAPTSELSPPTPTAPSAPSAESTNLEPGTPNPEPVAAPAAPTRRERRERRARPAQT